MYSPSFELNNDEWHVCICDGLDDIFIMSDGFRTIGVTDDLTKTIYIANGLNRNLFRHVLCHEIVHAICFSYDINMALDTEELFANLIATYGKEIIYVFRDVIAQFKTPYKR